MNWTQIEGKWDQLKDDAKSKWGKLTDDDLKMVGGKVDQLAGKIVERYGVKKEQAHKEIEEWVDRLRAKLDGIGKPSKPGWPQPNAEASADETPDRPRH